MPKARKLPSGSWRCQVYTGERIVNGKRRKIMESVTVDDPTEDGRIECERLARQIERAGKGRERMTVGNALTRYAESRSARVSVSTLTSYRSYIKTAYSALENVPVHMLTNEMVQEWLDDYAATHSPKTVRNAYGLLTAACRSVIPDLQLSVRLPRAKEYDYYTPTDANIKKLLRTIKGTDLERAVLLAAFGTLRRGEIAALLRSDIRKNTVTINKAYAFDGHGFVLKTTKTPSSVRTVTLPPEVIEIIVADRHGSDRIYPHTPNALTKSFEDARNAAGLPHFRFHDLRIYAASIRHSLKIPDQYIMYDGGWKSDSCLKKVYRRAMEDKRVQFAKVSNKHFSKMIAGTESGHTKRSHETPITSRNPRKITGSHPKGRGFESHYLHGNEGSD